MRVVALESPGRLQTVVYDPGLWWSIAAEWNAHELLRFNAAESFWKMLCSSRVKKEALSSLPGLQNFRQRLEWRAQSLDLNHSAAAAGRSLGALCTLFPYQSASRYIETIGPIASHLDSLNQAQGEIEFSHYGPHVLGLDYSGSASLLSYSREDTLLSRLIDAALEGCPEDTGLLAISVTSSTDVLTAMIAARLMRERNQKIHVCLADHGYENFTLHPHMGRLKSSGTFLEVFDTVIVSKDERDEVMPWLVETVAGGKTPTGFLEKSNLLGWQAPASGSFRAFPPTPTFSPEPVLLTRMSKKRCYWSRCAFCIQNLKYDNPQPPSLSEVDGSLDRIEALVGAGYKTFVFSDEAVSPAFMKLFCQGIEERQLPFKWACRCRLERALTPELLLRMKEAGCYEILFGLESISPRLQKLMGKHLSDFDPNRIRNIFQTMNDVGIGLFLTTIAGFPGDTPAEAEATVDFMVETLSGMNGATFVMNAFALFPDTPVMKDPGSFGVIPADGEGDMPFQYEYAFTPELKETADVIDMTPYLYEKLYGELGWRKFGAGSGVNLALDLYFKTGHGAIFKTQAGNPFANPLRADAAPGGQNALSGAAQSMVTAE